MSRPGRNPEGVPGNSEDSPDEGGAWDKLHGTENPGNDCEYWNPLCREGA